MLDLERISRCYSVSIRQAEVPECFRVSYSPRPAGANGAAKRSQVAFVAEVQVRAGLKWLNAPKDRDLSLEEFEKDAVGRVKLLRDWLALLMPLLDSIELWADELGWAKRRVLKTLQDDEIGNYVVPAVLLQEDMIRIAVEPIGRWSLSTEGTVDIYLMPAYDDIATLFRYDGRWNLHRASDIHGFIDTIHEHTSKPLNKKAFQEILEGMKNSVV